MANNIDKKTVHNDEKSYALNVIEVRLAIDEMQEGYKNKVFEVSVKEMLIKNEKMQIVATLVKPLKSKDKILPVVVYFHGGGWMMGDYKSSERFVAEIAYNAEVAVVAIDYALAPENKYPIAINQSYVATKWVFENAKELGVDSERLSILGGSAGGNIAAVVSQMAKDKNTNFIKYQILLSPVTNKNFTTESMKKFGGNENSPTIMRAKLFWDQYIDNEQAMDVYASPLQASIGRMAGLPPTLIITNENDIYRDEGEAYAHKLTQAGVEVTAVRYLDTTHNAAWFNSLANTPGVRSIIKQISAELKYRFT